MRPILDPAILRRPGRFDRVVHFPNPSAAQRREYFSRMPSDTQGLIETLHFQNRVPTR
jgi:ATP-dependent 26S proteasome regulatory subunit